MVKTAKEYIKSTDGRIKTINENGSKKLIFDISVSLGSDYKRELSIIEGYYKKKGFGIETRACRSKLVDITISW